MYENKKHLARMAALPTSAIVVWTANHKHWILVAFARSGPTDTVTIFIGAIIILGYRRRFWFINLACMHIFYGKPFLPFKDRAGLILTVLVSDSVRPWIEQQNRVALARFHCITSTIGRCPFPSLSILQLRTYIIIKLLSPFQLRKQHINVSVPSHSDKDLFSQVGLW